MNCCNPMTGKCEQGHGCPARETPHDKALRHFWEPNQALHIEAYTGPSRLQRVLDWVGNTVERLGKWPQFWTAIVLILACALTAVVGFSK